MNTDSNWCTNYYTKTDCVRDKDENCTLLTQD